MIDPSIWTNEDLARVPVFDRLIYIGLCSNADDSGRLKGSAGFIKAAIFPYDPVKPAQIRKAIVRLGKEKLIILYVVDGVELIQHPHWLKWQKIDRPTPSTFPPPPGYTPSTRRGFAEASSTTEHNTTEQNRSKENTSKPGLAHDGYRLLLNVGVAHSVASKLVEQYDETTIRAAIIYARDSSVRNKAAYVVSALRKGYTK